MNNTSSSTTYITSSSSSPSLILDSSPSATEYESVELLHTETNNNDNKNNGNLRTRDEKELNSYYDRLFRKVTRTQERHSSRTISIKIPKDNIDKPIDKTTKSLPKKKICDLPCKSTFATLKHYPEIISPVTCSVSEKDEIIKSDVIKTNVCVANINIKLILDSASTTSYISETFLEELKELALFERNFPFNCYTSRWANKNNKESN